MKRLWFALGTIFVSIVCVSGSAMANPLPSVAAAYAKANNTYDVVVSEPAGTTLKLYVNDKNPVQATANKKGWATFHKVHLVNNGKLSFTAVSKRSSGKTSEKPISYVRYVTVSSGKAHFSAPKVAVQTPAPSPTPAPTEAPTLTPAPETPAPTANTGVNDSNLSNNNTYTNADGNTVHSPANSTDGSIPAGATAQCRDGSYSFSQHRSGTCSSHGGVSQWL